MKRIPAGLIVVAVLSSLAFSQQTANPVRLYRQANEYRLLSDFMELLRLRKVASDTENV
jgi:hypothetical protein